MSEITRDEYDRMWRVVDTSLSAHSHLRDRYRRRHRAVTLLVMTLSIVATGFAFLSTDATVALGFLSLDLATLLGLLTMLIFFLALFDLIVDWRGRAGAHEEAGQRLSDLKAKLRAVTLSDNIIDQGDIDLRAEYEHTMATIIAIPEGQFLAMKAKHHRKVVVSKLIDTHPAAPVPYLRMLAIIRGLRTDKSARVMTGDHDEPIEESPVS